MIFSVGKKKLVKAMVRLFGYAYDDLMQIPKPELVEDLTSEQIEVLSRELLV